MTYPEPVAWKVEVNNYTVLTFATNERKARWKAVKHHREWSGEGRGWWPSLSAWRAPEYDKSNLRHQPNGVFDLDP